MKTIVYCWHEGYPAVLVMNEKDIAVDAYVFNNGAWIADSIADLMMKAPVMSKAAFEKSFGTLPSLPISL